VKPENAAKETKMEKLTLNTKEIQSLTGWGREHTQNLVRSGALPNVGNLKRVIVPRAALVRYLEQAGQR
jgi:hypothetical protein